MKKKLGSLITAIILACTMLFGVTGCNRAPSSNTSGGNTSGGNTSVGGGGTDDGGKIANFVMPETGFDTEKPVTIKFYHTMGQDLRKVLTNYISQFNQLYPNITVVEEAVGGYDDVREQIATELQGNDYPNLAYCYPDHVALFNQSKAVLALNDFLVDGAYKDMTITRKDGTVEPMCFTQEQTDAFIEGYYQEGYKYDDGTKMYTLPFSKSTEVLFYNKTFFDANADKGLKVPTTWDEMEQACKIIKEIDPKSTPLGYDSEANWFITMCEQYGSPYTSSTGENFLFNNAKNKEFVQMLQGWFNKGYFTTQEINESYTSNLFKAQTSYMCIGSSAGAKNQSPGRVDGEYVFEVGITSIPQVDPENPKVISQGPSVCIFKQDDPQEVIASWLLAKFLTTNIGFQAQFSSVSGYVPVIKTVTQNEIYKKNLDAANGFENVTYLSAKVCMEQEKAYYTSPAFFGSTKARDQVGYLMQAVFTGSRTIDVAFERAIEECKYYIGDEDY